MIKEIKPTQENNKILTEVLQAKVNKALKEKYPTAEDIVNEELNKPKRSIFK